MTANRIDLSAYKAIIFDMDGTLIDSMGAHMEAWKQTCDSFGIPFDRQYMHGLGGVPTKKTVEMLNEKYAMNHEPADVAMRKREVWETMDFIPALIAETADIFHHYRPSMKVAIGTGSERPHAEHLLNHHDLMSKLDAMVTASDVVHGKPHPETFLTAAKLMNVAPEDCVVFEDTEIGRQAAERAGMDCYLVIDGKVKRQGD